MRMATPRVSFVRLGVAAVLNIVIVAMGIFAGFVGLFFIDAELSWILTGSALPIVYGLCACAEATLVLWLSQGTGVWLLWRGARSWWRWSSIGQIRQLALWGIIGIEALFLLLVFFMSSWDYYNPSLQATDRDVVIVFSVLAVYAILFIGLLVDAVRHAFWGWFAILLVSFIADLVWFPFGTQPILDPNPLFYGFGLVALIACSVFLGLAYVLFAPSTPILAHPAKAVAADEA